MVRHKVTLLIVAGLMMTGCAAPPRDQLPADPMAAGREFERAAQEMYQVATIEAQQTARAERAIANATATAEAAIWQATQAARSATQEALDVQERQLALNATATAYVRDSNATVTAQAAQATATARAEATAQAERQATATVEAAIAAVQLTAQAGTAEAIARESEKEARRQILNTFGGFALVILALVALGAFGMYLAPVAKARLRVIRRQANEGEPLVMLERDKGGREQIMLPLRSFYAMLTTEENPPDHYQDRTTARAQLPAVVAAGRGTARRIIRGAAQPAGNSPIIRVVDPREVKPWLEDVEGQLLEEANG